MFPHNMEIGRLLFCFDFGFIPLCCNQCCKFWTQFMQYVIRYLQLKTTYKCIMLVFPSGLGVISQDYYWQCVKICNLIIVQNMTLLTVFYISLQILIIWWELRVSVCFYFFGIFFCMNTDRNHVFFSSILRCYKFGHFYYWTSNILTFATTMSQRYFKFCMMYT